MIPSVFISSTIADLHYVRETARKVVKDFALNPVMSDFAEIAYMGGRSAESSCYLSVKDCKIMVLIIGRRYGSLSRQNPNVSVTEHEFDTSQEHRPYLVTLIEKDVLNFKAVYDKNPGRTMEFPGMDEPVRTFAFINKVNSAGQDNGIFGFSNAEEVDRILRLQFAGLFGRLLDEKNRPEKESIKDVLSELQGLKASIGGLTDANRGMADEMARGARFMLEERNAQFAKLLNIIAPLDELIPMAKISKDFSDFLSRRHIKWNMVESLGLYGREGMLKYSKYDTFADPDAIYGFVPKRNVGIMEIGWTTATSVTFNALAYEYYSNRFAEFKDRVCGAISEG